MISKPKYEYDIKEKSIEFSIKTLKYLDKLETKRLLHPVIDQLVRSGTSVGANIHEAQSSHSVKEMMRYYRIALKSANESNYWLIVLENMTAKDEVVSDLKTELTTLRNILGKTLVKLKDKREQ